MSSQTIRSLGKLSPTEKLTVNGARQRATARLRFEQLEDRVLLATIQTTNTGGSGAGSLAQAIVDANNQPGLDRIEFNIPASDPGHQYYRDDGIAGQVTLINVAATSAAIDSAIADLDPDWPNSWYSISPTAALPDITDPVVIDGYSQGGGTPDASDNAVPNTNTVTSKLGLNTVLRIEINGQNAGELPKGILRVTSRNNTIRGLVINRTHGPKIYLEQQTDGSIIAGNFIGPDVSGSRAFAPAQQPGNVSFFDAVISLAAGDNEIGGTTAGARNLISGNTGPTSRVSGIFSNGRDRIQGNLIGTDRGGTRALGNARGIWTSRGGTLIGGPDPGATNVISFNQVGVEPGVRTGDPNNLDTVVQNNLIGTDVTGTRPLGNGDGIVPCINSVIVGNTVAFNRVGIRVSGNACKGNLITRNSVFSSVDLGIDLGFDSVTANDVPPASVPPDLDDGPNGLQNFPILTSVTDLTPGTRIQGVLTSTPSSNFRVEFFANSERIEDINGFGATTARPGEFGEGRTFVGSHDVSTNGSGVVNFTANLPALPVGQPYVTATATDITLVNGTLRNNTSEFSPIEPLGGCGLTITSTGDTGAGTLREAIFCSVFAEGVSPIGFAIRADDPRHFYYRDDGQAGQVTPANVTTTSMVNDAGIVGIDPDWPHSWFSIRPSRSLPTISERLIVDGYTQPGSRRNTIPAPGGLDTVLKIELDGSGSGRGHGLRLEVGAELSRIEGLAINGFSLSEIYMTTFGGNVIAGNFIGTDVSGTIARGGLTGIRMIEERFNRIGGTLPALRNLISGNNFTGITSESTGADVIEGNLIGTDRTKTRLLKNTWGVLISGTYAGSSLVTVGGTVPGAGNVIAGDRHAVWIYPNSFPQEPFKSGSLIDFLADCRRPLKTAMENRARFFATNDPADFDSVVISGSVFYLCATSFGQKDFIAQANSIVGNILTSDRFGVAIDLGNDDVTPNDGDDPSTLEIDPDFDGGPNNLQNFPVLSSATTTGGRTSIAGNLNSLPNTSFRLEFFSNTQLHPTGFGGGESWLGFMNVTTDSNGNGAFSFVSPEPVPAGRFITSTATLLVDLDDDPQTPSVTLDTSEFSRGIVVTGDSVVGDLDGNGVVDARDIDLLAAAIRAGSSESRFDLNGSGKVDAGDRRFLIEDILHTSAGDANLDGLFDSSDLVAVFVAGQYEDSIVGNSGWASGDWDGDGEFDTSDLVAAFQAGRYEQGKAVVLA